MQNNNPPTLSAPPHIQSSDTHQSSNTQKMMSATGPTTHPFYLAIGTTAEICSLPDGTEPTFPCTLEAWQHKQKIGRLRCDRQPDRLHIFLDQKEPACTPEAVLEALRLFSRICTRLDGYTTPLELILADAPANAETQLKADGFTLVKNGPSLKGDSVYTRPGGKFLRTSQPLADDMEHLYHDPFTVPWNFVPLEMDVLQFLPDANFKGSHYKLLDLGCGFGKNASYLEKASNYEVYGIDIAASAIARCKDIVSFPDRFRTGTATALPWVQESFDIVLDIGCLHCLPASERRAAITEAARVLKKGGLMLSRFFKPRSEQWIREQPFKVTTFGLPYDELIQLYEGLFQSEKLHETDHAWYIRAIKL